MPPEMPSPDDVGPLHKGGGLIKGWLGFVLIGAVGGAVLVGFLIYNFKPEWFGNPTATPTGTPCMCQGTTLVCGDVESPNHPSCGGGAPTPTDVTQCGPGWLPEFGCVCCRTTFICSDGTYVEFAPQCAGATVPPPIDIACQCEGADYVCSNGNTNYNSSQCGGSNICICRGTTLVCPDGTYAEFNPQCGVGGSDQCSNSTCGDGTCNAACGEDINTCAVDCHL